MDCVCEGGAEGKKQSIFLSAKMTQDELFEKLFIENETLKNTINDLQIQLNLLKQRQEGQLLQKQIELTDAQLRIAQLEISANDLKAKDLQIQELSAAIDELTQLAKQLHEQLLSSIQDKDRIISTTSEQAEELSNLQQITQTLNILCTDQLKLNQLNEQIANTYRELQEQLTIENNNLKAETEAVKSVAQQTVNDVTLENQQLLAILASVQEEKRVLEATVKDIQSSPQRPPSPSTPPSCSPMPPPPTTSPICPRDQEVELLQGKLTATSAALLHLQSKLDEMETWQTQQTALTQNYTAAVKEKTLLEEQLRSVSKKLDEVNFISEEQQTQLRKLQEDQQKLMLVPPTIAGIESRCARVACNRLQEHILQLELELMEDAWARIPDIAFPIRTYEEADVINKLQTRDAIIAELTRNVVFEEQPQSLSQLVDCISQRNKRIDKLLYAQTV